MPTRLRATHLALAVLACSAIAGAQLGCISAFSPNIRAMAHHNTVARTDQNDDCLGCHDTESEAQAVLDKLPPAERHAVIQAKLAGKPTPSSDHNNGHQSRAHSDPAPMPENEPPLVQDWMAQDERTCVQCHKVKSAR